MTEGAITGSNRFMRNFHGFKFGSQLVMAGEAQIHGFFPENLLMITGMVGMAGQTITLGIGRVCHLVFRHLGGFMATETKLALVKRLPQQTFFRTLMRLMAFTAISITERLV